MEKVVGQGHLSDVIMGAMASPITSLTIVYSTVHLGTYQRKHHSSSGNSPVTGEFPAQMASNAENPFDDVIMASMVLLNVYVPGIYASTHWHFPEAYLVAHSSAQREYV